MLLVKEKPVILMSDSSHIFVQLFNSHHIMWLHHSNATDLAGIYTLNFSISQSLIQIINFPMHFCSNSDRHASILDLSYFLPGLMLCSAAVSSWRPHGNVCRYLSAHLSSKNPILTEHLSVINALAAVLEYEL